MDASDNGDDTYTCKVKEDSALNGFSATTAPILMPVETPGYASAKALNDEILMTHQGMLEQLSYYTSQGFVFVLSGCRGTNEGAPTGVTDLKAAIRYIRYADDVIAGDAESIFVYGMSGGGAQAAILGASGDSELYTPYLEAIGAVQGVSDSTAGVMAWCPVTDLDTANAGYEWMMGCTRPQRPKEEEAISDGLANAYAAYVNDAGFTDEERACFTHLLESGFIDTFRHFYPDMTSIYSWWSYRFQSRAKNAGWRIDYFVVSEALKDRLVDAKIHTQVMGSDHCPVELTLS